MSPADGALPLDSDVEAGPRARPVHLRLGAIGLVAAGGAVGTAARVAVALVVPAAAGLPLATFSVNVVGAFVLGVLLESLVRRGPDEGARQRLRLLLGTGFCGGFTTYSTLAVDVADRAGAPAAALAVLVGTLVVGALATAAGIAVGARRA